MKPELVKIPNETLHSFNIREDILPNVNNRWHYHPEIELIHFHKGSGTQFVGDHITRFGPGNMVLVGANLPHYWKYDTDEMQNEADTIPYSTVIHFYEDFWSSHFLELPENKIIKKTLKNALRGLQITGRQQPVIAEIMKKMLLAEGPKRIILLMECLLAAASCNQAKQLSSVGFSHHFDESDKERINLIYDFSFSNFKKRILLAQVAGVANLSPQSFCRYFKAKTRKTYSQFINELRIGNACKLLIDNNAPVKQICYESGYNNFSSFHTSFKLITGKTPLSYRHEFLPTN